MHSTTKYNSSLVVVIEDLKRRGRSSDRKYPLKEPRITFSTLSQYQGIKSLDIFTSATLISVTPIKKKIYQPVMSSTTLWSITVRTLSPYSL